MSAPIELPDSLQLAAALIALEESQRVVLEQAQIVTKVLDVLTEVATAAQVPAHGLYEEGVREGQVQLVKRLFELIKREREK